MVLQIELIAGATADEQWILDQILASLIAPKLAYYLDHWNILLLSFHLLTKGSRLSARGQCALDDLLKQHSHSLVLRSPAISRELKCEKQYSIQR